VLRLARVPVMLPGRGFLAFTMAPRHRLPARFAFESRCDPPPGAYSVNATDPPADAAALDGHPAQPLDENRGRNVTLCYALLRFVTLCYALLRFVTLCYAFLLLFGALWCVSVRYPNEAENAATPL